MSEDIEKKDDEFGFDSAGQALGYISLEQAQIAASRHVRENRNFYGPRYANREMIWEQISSREGEDYYYIQLSYRPAGQFKGKPGVELLTIDKAGPVEVREIVQEVVEPRNWLLILSTSGALILVAAVLGSLFAAGVFIGPIATHQGTFTLEPDDEEIFAFVLPEAAPLSIEVVAEWDDGTASLELALGRPDGSRTTPVEISRSRPGTTFAIDKADAQQGISDWSITVTNTEINEATNGILTLRYYRLR